MPAPISRANAPSVTSPMSLDPTPATPQAATPLPVGDGPIPTGYTAPPPAPASGPTGNLLAARSAPKKIPKDLFALVPGRYPDAIGLPTILAQAGQSDVFVAKIAELMQKSTGLAPSPALIAAATANPTRIADLLVATPGQLHVGIDGLNAAYKAGKLPKLPPKSTILPKTFDLAKFAAIPFERKAPELKELAPGLLQGDLPSSVSDAELKSNVVFAEVLDRLAENADVPEKDRFKAKIGTHTFSTLPKFLESLEKDGHTFECTVEHRVANFANLKTKTPEGAVLDVPAALMVRTGIKHEGKEAVVPAVHSELVIRIRSSETTKGPKVDANVKWYQGISGTGFFPCDASATPSWCGKAVSDSFSGAQAAKSVELAGMFSDLINAAAKKLDLAVGGYGATGVCNDSVAIIQHAMTGKTAAYPLIMRDDLLSQELLARVSDKNQSDDPEYTKLAESIALVPSDRSPNESQRERALASLPWAPGAEPLQSSVAARDILTAAS